jgi:acetoacetate decarboxylase
MMGRASPLEIRSGRSRRTRSSSSSPAATELFEHGLCGVARLPVRDVVSSTHDLTDIALGLGEVVYDYLKAA